MADWDLEIFGRAEVVRSHQPLAMTIGNFDGVHLGHRHVISTLKDFANGLPTVALTFDPHPSSVLAPAQAKPSIESVQERIETLLSLGLDAVVVQKFTPEFAKLSANDFVSKYLLKEFNCKRAVIGFDFCYGVSRQGDWDHFRNSAAHYGFAALRAEPLYVDGIPVSSSRIRQAVQAAEFSTVEKLMGREFSLSGVVVQGDQRGRQIGFPTANLGLSREQPLLPPYGVYAVEVQIEGESNRRFGVMNCGVRPTIASGLKLQIETHILDYVGDLYGKKIIFRPKKFIRTEMKFSSLEQLKSQIQIDSNEARAFFGV